MTSSYKLPSGATILLRGDYAKIVSHFKVFREDDGQWSIDGRDDYGNYTESCWQYDTFEQAVAAIPEFAASIIEDGIEFFPRRNGNTVQVIGVRAYDTMWEYLDGEKAEARYRAEIDYSVERGRNDTIVKYTGIRPADWPDLEDMRNGETVSPDFPPINYWVIQEAEVKP